MTRVLVPDMGPKPLMRGWAHAVSFPLWMVSGALMIVANDTSRGGALLLLVYVIGTGLMFGVSALYHRGRWRPSVKALLQRFDRSAIFLAIAGGHTPVIWVVLHGTVRTVMMVIVWSGAVAGIVLHWLPRSPRALRGASYIVVSWVAVVAMPQLYHEVSPRTFWLILAGGTIYTVGAIALAARWPDPWPRHFGFHEIFHAFTVVAAALQFTAIATGIAPQL